MRITSTSTLVALSAVVGLSSCATTQQSTGLRQVDDLVGAVELVHLEAELTKQQLFDTLGKLHVLVSPGFAGDPMEAYTSFALSVEACEEQSAGLRHTREPMERSADTVFERWEDSLDAFSGASMRERSAVRLADARGRYEVVRDAAAQAQEAFDAFHSGMQDMALFLEHDFNPSSVAAIEDDARALAANAQSMRETLDICMIAAERYVREAAPLGQVEVTPVDPAPRSVRNLNGEARTTPKPQGGTRTPQGDM